MNTQELNKIDPLAKQASHTMGKPSLSPMDPPEAYAPPSLNQVLVETMHPFLKKLVDEHTLFLTELGIFEETILSIQRTGFTRELDAALKHFFHFFDEEFVIHSRREETDLFPLLRERMIAEGEHGTGENPTTPIDIMNDDHLKAVQLAAVILNFRELAFRLADEKSRLIVLDAALEQGKNLVELMRLHIFREDNIVFPQAHRLILHSEFDEITEKVLRWNKA
jgi:hemerythrin-like domain-containing protein